MKKSKTARLVLVLILVPKALPAGRCALPLSLFPPDFQKEPKIFEILH